MVMGNGETLLCDRWHDGKCLSCEGQSVGDLKDEIKNKNRDIACPAWKLQLFLAKKGSAWLPDDENLDAILRARILDTSYRKKSRASWSLDEPLLFGSSPSLGTNVIHVLVVIPKQEVVDLSEFAVGIDEVAPTKRKRYTHSEMSLTRGITLLRDLNLELTDPVPVEAFKWESIIDEHGQTIVLTEEQQRKRYQKYVEDNLRDVLVKEKLYVVGTEGPNILSVIVPGYDIELVGRTDLLIMSDVVKEYPHYVERLPGVKMLTDVKKNATTHPGAVYQTVSGLVALDFLASDLVVALLTNLTDYWEFLWISDRSNNYVNIRYAPVAHPSAAFAMIRALLTLSDAEISFPWVEEPVKQYKLKQVLPVSEGGGSSGILEAIERYRDIESVLGPDMEMTREVGRQVVRSIPIFSMYT